jgi:hypothetical protein
MTDIAKINATIDPTPSQAFTDLFNGTDWTAATGLDPHLNPVLDGDTITFEDIEACKVLDAIREKLPEFDRAAAEADSE